MIQPRPAVLPRRSTRPLIAAHRGASRVAPENSLPAVERAIEFGADMIEIDVRRTRDGVLIAHHDPTIGDRTIGDLTFADVTAAMGGAPATIDGIVSMASGRALLDIELKEEGYEHDVLRLLARYLTTQEFIVTSFLETAVVAAKRQGVRTGLLCTGPCAVDEVLEAVERTGADALIPHFELAQDALLAGAAERRLPVMVWTVNEPAVLHRCLADRRIDGVITDVPDVAIAIRRDIHPMPDPDECEPAA